MGDALWTLDDVTLAGAAKPRLDAVRLVLRPGTTAVLGPSGAGKTSLLNLLVGFERATRGKVARGLDSGTHALSVYWVPQGGGLWPHLRACEHVEQVTPARAGALDARTFLALFDLEHRAEAFPDELSQGERSRLSVARALAADTAALVMDEPLAHVDTSQAARFWDVIREHSRQNATSLVFATHSPGTVLAEADRVVCIRDGRVDYDGEVEELYHRPATRELAECLGEVNWFEPEEARVWLGVASERPVAVRPERLVVQRADAGALVVREARFKGGVADAEIVHEPTGAARRVLHRPASDGLRPGARVILKLLALVVAAAMIGCGASSDPVLSVAEERYWPMPPDETMIPAPRSLATGPRDETVCLDMRGRVLIFDANGTLLRSWRMQETANGRPEGVRVLKDGRIAVSDTHYHRVVFFDIEGKLLGTFGKEGTGPGEFIFPVGITQDDDGFLYVCEYGSNDRVQKFTPEGKFVLSFGSFGMGPGQFQRPSGMACRAGKVYVADAMNNRIQVYTTDGKYERDLGAPDATPELHFPYDLAFDSKDALYIVEYGAGRLTKVSTAGRVLGRYGTAGAGEGQFRTPWGMTIDSKDRVRIADTGNHRIVELRP